MSVEFFYFFFLLAFLGGRGWALINFFHFLGGRLFKVGAYSSLGAKSNKYGNSHFSQKWYVLPRLFIIRASRRILLFSVATCLAHIEVQNRVSVFFQIALMISYDL